MRDFRQHDVTDCGVACMAYVFDRHGLSMSFSALRQKCGTNRSGTTALGLVETAKACGFESKGLRCKFEDLRGLPLPGVAHVMLESGRQHYVVVCGITQKNLQIMDPSVGRVERWPVERFKACWTNVFIIFSPATNFRPSRPTDSAWIRLLTLLGPQRRILLQAFVGVVLTTILSLASAVYIQKIVDNVIVDGNRNLLRLLGVAMMSVLLIRAIIGYCQATLMLRSAQRIDAGLILGYYRHLMRLPQSFFDTMRIGEITARVRDAVAVRDFLNGTILSLILNPLILIVAVVAMFAYSWRLAVFSLVLVPVNVGLYFASDWLNRRYQREIMERSADFQAHLVESLHAMSVVRSCGLEDEMSFRTETRFVRVLKRVWSAGNMGFVVGGAGGFVTQAYSVGLLWIGAGLVLDSQLTAGELMSCNALAGYITGPIVAIIGMNASIRAATTATDRLYEILDLEREVDEGTSELSLADRFEVRLEGVEFRYPGRLATLKAVTLTFPSGTITGLVGPSGCGKSTLLALLQRHYLPDGGKIIIGGIDSHYVKLQSLRRSIAYVPQKVDLLAGTVLDNIAPNEAQPDLPRIVQLCRSVGILEFIEALPRGFQTLITENGANLSGGQKQRLAIVRALYCDAPIVLMDEPSSALDAEAEAMLIRTVSAMRARGKLIILAVHNRRMLAICDAIVELADGKVVRQSQGASPAPTPLLAEPTPTAEPLPPGPVDEAATPETKRLWSSLRDPKRTGVLFGQCNANVTGVDEEGRGWILQDGRCDLHATTGQWPAIYGFEVPELRRGWNAACGFLGPKIREAHQRNGVVTVAWYCENLATGADRWNGCGVSEVLPGGARHAELRNRLDLIADHLGGLKDLQGHAIPVIFRCWPQPNDDRFWWGRSRCSPEEYTRLFRFTVTYLRDVRRVRNFLYAFAAYFGQESFDGWSERYPGDDYVDVVSVDRIADESERTRERFLRGLSEVVAFAEDRRKVAGISAVFCYRSTNDHGLPPSAPTWLADGLLGPIKAHPQAGRIRFLVFWQNDPARPDRYQLPPPQSPHAESLVQIADDPFWVFATGQLAAAPSADELAAAQSPGAPAEAAA